MIFPCSDFRHAVMTPAILLMSEYLMRCPITSGPDIAIGSFLCSMLLSVSIICLTFCLVLLEFRCFFRSPSTLLSISRNDSISSA